MQKNKSYDPGCEELARFFLSDEEEMNTAENRADLAQDIQDTIENWFATMKEGGDHAHTCQQCDKVMSIHCACGKPNEMTWCSSNCRAAYDL